VLPEISGSQRLQTETGIAIATLSRHCATRSLLAALPLVLAASAALANNALVVQNLCTETIWIRQQTMNPAGGGVNNPDVVTLAPKASHTTAVASTVATPSVALWPKTGCDAT
jgi:hypothetical protein